jgi:hypothetical protein
MSSAMKYSLAAEAEEYRQSPRPAVVDLLSNRREVPTDDAKAEPKGIAQSISDILDSMEQELSAIKGPIRVPGNRIAIKSADLLSLRMDAAEKSEDSSDRAQDDRQSYRRVMLLLDDQVRHLRLSERLQEQDYADALERWLVSELSRPGRREIFTDQQYAHIVAGLADQDARHQARRRAIVMAWHESTVQRKHQFRNDAAIKKKVILAPRWLVARRDAAMAAEDLLKRLESSVPRQLTYPGELYSLSLRAVPPPGLLWHRPWEAKAKQLAESLKSTPAIKGADDE